MKPIGEGRNPNRIYSILTMMIKVEEEGATGRSSRVESELILLVKLMKEKEKVKEISAYCTVKDI
jgi:hypothetical protein